MALACHPHNLYGEEDAYLSRSGNLVLGAKYKGDASGVCRNQLFYCMRTYLSICTIGDMHTHDTMGDKVWDTVVS